MKRIPFLIAFLGLVFSAVPTLTHQIGLLAETHHHHYDHEVILRQPTCTETGLGYIECPEDGEKGETVEIPALGHHLETKVVEATCTQMGFTVTYCTRCGYEVYKTDYVDPLGHDFHTYEIPATCSAPGHMERFCSRCGIDEFEPYTIDAKGHDYVLEERVAPGCESEGYDVMVCVNCGKHTYANFVDPLGHSFHYDIHDPTCTEDGYTIRECTRCGLYRRIKGPKALGHSFVHHEEVAPTCAGEGMRSYDECLVCGYVEEAEPLDALGHQYVRSYVVEPTCVSEGYTVYECKNCHDVRYDDIIPALGHDLIHHDGKGATCDQPGHEAYDTCSRCDYSTYVEIAPLGEEHHFQTTVIAPTTTTGGYSVHTCLTCGYSYIDDEVEPLTPNRKTSSFDAISAGISPLNSTQNAVQSIRNDDAYFFLAYLGHVSDMPVHTFVSFLMDKGTASLQSYPTSTAKPTQGEMKERIDEMASTFLSNGAQTLLASELVGDISNISRVNTWDHDQFFKDSFQASGGKFSPLEISDPNLASLATQASSIKTSYKAGENLDQYDIGYTYSYAIVGEADFFLGATYDIKTQKFEYRPYTMVSSLKEKVFASSSLAGGSLYDYASPFAIDTQIASKLVKPTRYQTNHPYVPMTDVPGVRYELTAFNPDPTYEFRSSDIKGLVEQGYDTFRGVVTWNWDRGLWGEKTIYFNLSLSDTMVLWYDDGHYISEGKDHQGFWYYSPPETPVTWDFRAPTDYLLAYGGFNLNWWHGGGAISQGVFDINIKLYFYNSSAKADGAYAGTPVEG